MCTHVYMHILKLVKKKKGTGNAPKCNSWVSPGGGINGWFLSSSGAFSFNVQTFYKNYKFCN